MPTPRRITTPGLPGFANRRDLPCRNTGDPDLWYADATTSQDRAKRICQRCPAVKDCLLFALDHDLSFGIWGSHTPAERQAIHKVREQRRRHNQPPPALPDPPARATAPFRWPGGNRTTPVGRIVDAAQRIIDGERVKTVAAEARIHDALLAKATAMLRWAPELEDDVRDGWVSLAAAADYARRVNATHIATAAQVAA